MSFKRWLTSVLCSCILLSSILVIPASAADDNDYYSVPPVAASEPSLSVNWPVNPVSGEYSSILGAINQSLGGISSQIADVLHNQVAIAQILSGISGIVTDNGRILGRIESSVGILSTISDKVATESTLSAISGKVATDSTLTSLSTFLSQVYDGLLYGSNPTYGGSYRYAVRWSDGSLGYLSWGHWLFYFAQNLRSDVTTPEGGPSLYHMIRLLQESLASDDDRQLAENYKENRQQAEQDFLSGKSGKTSLGKDDFGSLSSVGGTFHDISSLNGQASLDSFSSGLSDADTAGQGWFSQSTKDALDSVSGSTTSESTVSTFSDDGLYSVDIDSDPYNMGNFENHYAWLWGDGS